MVRSLSEMCQLLQKFFLPSISKKMSFCSTPMLLTAGVKAVDELICVFSLEFMSEE